MNTFINQVLNSLVKKGLKPHQASYVVPSQRVAIFLKKAIAQHIDQPVFAPTIYSVEDFIAHLAQVSILPDVDLLFDFYTAYCTIEPTDQRDNLDEFLTWAPTMLKDFNEIDRFLVPEDDFFNYLGNLKALENNQHWSLKTDTTAMVKNYLSFWNKLKSYYHAFKTHCITTGRVYQGLAYRLAFAKAKSQQPSHTATTPVVFMGLNALNKSEESIIKIYLNQGNAHIFWDSDTLYMNDYIHEAGKFLRTYKKTWNYYEKHPFEHSNTSLNKLKKISIHGVNGNLGMAQVAGAQLQRFIDEDPDMSKTAIILADEGLLMPVLTAMPESIKHFNITMGLGISKTPLANFFDSVIQMQVETSENGYYFKNVVTILESSFCSQLAMSSSKQLLHKIAKENMVNIPKDFYKTYQETDVLYHLLKGANTVIELQEKLRWLVAQLKLDFIKAGNKSLEFEQLLGIHTTLNHIEKILTKESTIQGLKTYHQVYRQFINQQQLDFVGEPVQGLQVMGLLETRAIDYDRFIMISVNEGILPAGKSTASVIPYDMKMKFGLPTYSDKDSVYAYHFYRLLHRASEAVFIYNTQPSRLGSNERSRFLMQLEAEKTLTPFITHHTYGLSLKKAEEPKYEITKTDSYFDRLEEIRKNGFSPSSLTSYIYNPLEFYKKKILKIQDLEEVEEDIASNTMGTIIHNALENLYKDCIDQVLTIDL